MKYLLFFNLKNDPSHSNMNSPLPSLIYLFICILTDRSAANQLLCSASLSFVSIVAVSNIFKLVKKSYVLFFPYLD